MRILLPFGSLLLVVSSAIQVSASAPQKPNFIIISCDNLGYGDVGCFGSKLHRTPNIDRMAEEGMRLTSFYATSGVCSPSRPILRSVGYRYWYTSFMPMTKDLAARRRRSAH